ncbi:NADP-dependent oxidoreductase domain-containing protein [Phascolomyces articulosus]|uniref:NADP-dependent oxidoreductase domain-containing protein n=1 Tax=Phascolomyces articulosus TaxID=60185 RepID=A0AAD5K178_9FUNG|nr:NADP-dependent oxidoreductase domain-containing protein [Phascolomyces articulosus]
MSNNNNKMQYVRLGNTGMKVSRICLGGLSFGSSRSFDWIKDEKESIELIGKAYEAGINFFDTANIYSNGESERVLGKAVHYHKMSRSRIVVATKLFFPVMPNVEDFAPSRQQLENDSFNGSFINDWGLSRKHIMDAIEDTLKRLQLDYIDILQIHRLDPHTTMEETMETLHDLIKAGKVRYIGASSMPTWQFQKANNVAEKNGWTPFTCMTNFYNLLYREEEREMIPYCADQKIAVIPWSPLAMGLLTGGGKGRNTLRSEQTNQVFGDQLYDETIAGRVEELASKKNVKPAQIALAWLYSKPYITAPIVGIGNEQHLVDAVGALNIKLTEEETKFLEECYSPRPAHYLT